MTAPVSSDLAWLDDLERAHAAATPGPWAEWDSAVVNPATPARDVFVECDHHADAALIVAAVNAFPTLIAELRKRDAALRAVEALAERYEATSKRRRQLAERWQEAGRWQLADAFRNLAHQSDVAADRLRSTLTAALSPESVQS